MYSIVQDVLTGEPQQGYVRRVSDGAFIPDDPRNMDYQAYLKWVDEGGVLSQTDPFYTPLPE